MPRLLGQLDRDALVLSLVPGRTLDGDLFRARPRELFAQLSALIETPGAYRFYFGVYVREVGHFTRVYMAVIDPFRKVVVYPSLLRSVRATWNRTFGKA